MIKKILFTLCLLLLTSYAPAAEVTVKWEKYVDTAGDLGGFILGYGEASGVYSTQIAMGKGMEEHTVGGLEHGKTYYFALLAYDISENNSSWSNEVNHFVPTEVVPDTTPPLPPIIIQIPESSQVEINIGSSL